MSYELENTRMIKWLKDKPPIIVHAAALSLNWDFAKTALQAIAEATNTDEATASALFLLSTPSNHFPYRHKPPNGVEQVQYPSPSYKDVVDPVIISIARRWPAVKYLKGHVELDNQKGFKYSEWGHHPEVYFYLRSQKEFGPLGKMPWSELVGIEGPFQGETPKHLLEYFKKDSDVEYHIRAMFEDLGTWLGGIDRLDTDYRKWRVANGFGLKPSWQSE